MNTTQRNFDYKKFNMYRKSPRYWGKLDHTDNKHRKIMSLLHQLGWVYQCPKTGRNRPDHDKLGEWLQSDRSPVKRPIPKMTPKEVSKIITALEGILYKEQDNG
jgi:hypothetical protein